nr:Uncharacterised protein [Raoultella sp. NCTC 9187]
MVRMLRYDSTSIAQIAWMHAEYGPMALCISAQRQPGSAEISSEQRHGMNLAWWHDRGYQFRLNWPQPRRRAAKQRPDAAGGAVISATRPIGG